VKKNHTHYAPVTGRGCGGAGHGLLGHDSGTRAHLPPCDVSQCTLEGRGDLPAHAGLRRAFDGGRRGSPDPRWPQAPP
jgi:hypothetical protein